MNNVSTFGQHVHLIRHAPTRTLFAMHDKAATRLMMFPDRKHAFLWAHSLETYKKDLGEFPSRALPESPKIVSLAWVMQSADADADLAELEIVRMPSSEAHAMAKFSGMNARVVLDPHNINSRIDVEYKNDRATTVTLFNKFANM